MRKLMLLFVFLTVSGSVTAITLDEDYMQTMEDRQKSLSANIGIQNAKGANEDAGAMIEMFSEVSAYYLKKGNAQDAVDWSNESRELATVIIKYLAGKDYDNATVSATKMAKTCKDCHRLYKKEKENK